jgi:hypothetical protein
MERAPHTTAVCSLAVCSIRARTAARVRMPHRARSERRSDTPHKHKNASLALAPPSHLAASRLDHFSTPLRVLLGHLPS